MSPQVEQLVTLPVDDEFTYAGKIDEVDPVKGRIVDYKGVTSISDFIDSKGISPQVELYAIAAEHALGVEIKEVEYRLIERPTISFCGKDNDDPDFYEMRCRIWLREKNAVRGIVVPINPDSLEYARKYLAGAAKRIRSNREDSLWMPNEEACRDYNRTCEFLPLCTAIKYGADVRALIERDSVRREVRHEELDRDDKNTLTYSSCKMCFQCETKYFWQYEAQLRRAGETAGEAMWIGRALHLGTETLARGGVEAARAAIADWGSKQKIIGQEMKHKRDEMLAKAKAMMIAAGEKWLDLPVEEIFLPVVEKAKAKKKAIATKTKSKTKRKRKELSNDQAKSSD